MSCNFATEETSSLTSPFATEQKISRFLFSFVQFITASNQVLRPVNTGARRDWCVWRFAFKWPCSNWRFHKDFLRVRSFFKTLITTFNGYFGHGHPHIFWSLKFPGRWSVIIRKSIIFYLSIVYISIKSHLGSWIFFPSSGKAGDPTDRVLSHFAFTWRWKKAQLPKHYILELTFFPIQTMTVKHIITNDPIISRLF